MDQILKDFSALTLIPAIEANLFEYLMLFARSQVAGLEVTPDLVHFITGVRHPAWNGVLRARFASQDVGHEVKAALAPFKSQRLPMFWWVGPSTRPVDLCRYLEAE